MSEDFTFVLTEEDISVTLTDEEIAVTITETEEFSFTLDEVIYAQGSYGYLVTSVSAGEGIFAHRVIAIIDGEAFLADPTNVSHIGSVAGISLNAAILGAAVNVATEGVVVEPGWAWNPGPIYLSLGGLLTQTPPASGIYYRIGQARSPTSMFVKVESPIIRS